MPSVALLAKGKSGKDSKTLTCVLCVAEYECKDKAVIRGDSMEGFDQPYGVEKPDFPEGKTKEKE